MRRNPSPSKDEPREHKIFSRSKWRDKLFSADRKDEKPDAEAQSQESDIAQFLNSSSRNDDDRLLDAPADPRILGGGNPTGPHGGERLSPPPPRNIYHRAKPRQNKGLHVTFVATAPEIIGEGGDEAELPPTAISRHQTGAPQVTLLFEAASQHEPSEAWEALTDARPNDEIAAPASAQTLSTRSQSQRLRRRSVQDIGDVHPSALGGEKSEGDGEASPVSPVSPLSDQDDSESYFQQPTRQFTLDEDAISPPEVDNAGNSLTPRASPEPMSLVAQSRNLPFRPSDAPKSSEPVYPRDGLHPPGASVRSQEQPHHEVKANARSLRNVAKGLGLEAIDDFDTRVSRFEEIFNLGVSVHQDVMHIPFWRWLHAATWWFLKGRGALEVEIRRHMRTQPQPTEPNLVPGEISTGMKQAFVDLAKAWWIVKAITPKHPEIRRYGHTSVKSMVAILRNFGNKDLADQAQHHVDLVANIKALAMSMKRNSRLPPPELEIQRLDVKVLYDEVPVRSDVQHVLFYNLNAHSKIHGLLMPLGDTSKFFTFTRMFGDLSIVSRDQSLKPPSIPCILSLVRFKDSLDLAASMSSQDGRVNMMIQSNGRNTPSVNWHDIRWDRDASHISFSISSDIDLVLQLSLEDFKALWAICDYISKVRKDFAGRRGEELVFETVLDKFQCVNFTKEASSFPQEAISLCRVRLFTAAGSGTEGGGMESSGFRLISHTPPGLKILSSISQRYGSDAPTIFGFGPRHEQPRLSIREAGSSTLVLTFIEWDQLDSFYGTITKRMPTEFERKSPPIALNEADISTFDENARLSRQHLPDHRWTQLRVICLKPSVATTLSPTQRWQGLRLVMHSETGTMTDQFLVGKKNPFLNRRDSQFDSCRARRNEDESQCQRLQ